jgi:hypothetical protein
MKHFIHRENLRLLREQLKRTTDEEKCQRIVRLIKEEELKDFASEDVHSLKLRLESDNGLNQPQTLNCPQRPEDERVARTGILGSFAWDRRFVRDKADAAGAADRPREGRHPNSGQRPDWAI